MVVDLGIAEAKGKSLTSVNPYSASTARLYRRSLHYLDHDQRYTFYSGLTYSFDAAG